MPHCPDCTTALRTVQQREGIYFSCDQCGGRAVTFPQIRRMTGDRFASSLLRQVNTRSRPGTRPCPFCSQPMRQLSLPEPCLELDTCRPCSVIWFDPNEFEALPEGAIESQHSIHLRAAEAMGQYRIDRLKEAERLTAEELSADLGWRFIPALFGFPVQSDAGPMNRIPWFNWSLTLSIILVSVAAFFDLDKAVDVFGFIPTEAWRYGGLTFLSSFFLHAGVFHLLGNMYFLLIFGNSVEEHLGCWRYGLLILVSTLVGDLVHLAASSASTVPCIGASGGISGVIVFYALQFPRARLGFLLFLYLRFHWIQIPAWGAMVLWLLLQGIGVYRQLSGFSNVAATAHLGGAAVGIALWFCWRKIENQSPD